MYRPAETRQPTSRFEAGEPGVIWIVADSGYDPVEFRGQLRKVTVVNVGVAAYANAMPIQCVVNVKAAEHRNVIEQLEQSVAVLAGQVCTVDLFRPNLLEERLDVTSRGVDEVQSLEQRTRNGRQHGLKSMLYQNSNNQQKGHFE
jgi:hypothetical protein